MITEPPHKNNSGSLLSRAERQERDLRIVRKQLLAEVKFDLEFQRGKEPMTETEILELVEKAYSKGANALADHLHSEQLWYS